MGERMEKEEYFEEDSSQQTIRLVRDNQASKEVEDDDEYSQENFVEDKESEALEEDTVRVRKIVLEAEPYVPPQIKNRKKHKRKKPNFGRDIFPYFLMIFIVIVLGVLLIKCCQYIKNDGKSIQKTTKSTTTITSTTRKEIVTQSIETTTTSGVVTVPTTTKTVASPTLYNKPATPTTKPTKATTISGVTEKTTEPVKDPILPEVPETTKKTENTTTTETQKPDIDNPTSEDN